MNNTKKRHLTIRHKLALKGSSFSEIARSLGVSHTTVTAVSNGRSRSLRVADAIANKLGTTPHVLWPEIYAEDDLSAHVDHVEIHRIEQLYFYDLSVSVTDICRRFNVTNYYLKKKFGNRPVRKKTEQISMRRKIPSDLLDSDFDAFE
ncbi:helix-turn-helix domain-containing protein [Celeribacter naphthalenivorans]|uniref:helix-turn-helix domain-containing protein n=1 Tax=Celeribacter naphthalenivorans TaxID=1614694 RepID=UPI001CFBC341|nr:helix-turn-helix domain-containing protein [Celeribacter naphthalenivorans]